MELKSNDMQDNLIIDRKFTCDGGDISPHLKWNDAPNKIKSFAISCNDPDAPAGDWVHWFVCNIPNDLTEIPQGGPVPIEEIENDFGKTNYGGPCPPSRTHRYFFRVFTLNVEKLEGVSKQSFREKVNNHLLEKAELMVKYSQNH